MAFYCIINYLFLSLQSQRLQNAIFIGIHQFIKYIITMVQYTADTEQIARAYNLQPQEVITAFALAAGAPPADTYRLIYHIPTKTTNNEIETTINALLTNKPSMKILINRIKNHQNPVTLKKEEQTNIQNQNRIKEVNENISEEERDEYKTRTGLIDKIITQVNITSGKEAISGLQTLAKMQGLDKPEEQEQDERRKYFLPWVSHCRSCKLMTIYKEVLNTKPTK